MEPPEERFQVVTSSNGHKSLISLVALSRGDVLCAFTGKKQRGPNRYTIQTGESSHELVFPVELRFINHSCDPNVAFDVTRRFVRVLRAIPAGSEFQYFYPSTEWNMAEPFDCFCGAANCLGWIRGAKHIAPEILERYVLQDHIQARLASPLVTSPLVSSASAPER